MAPNVQLKTVEESYQKTLLRFASFSAIVSEMVFDKLEGEDKVMLQIPDTAPVLLCFENAFKMIIPSSSNQINCHKNIQKPFKLSSTRSSTAWKRSGAAGAVFGGVICRSD